MKVARVVGNGVAVGVCAMGVVLGVVAHGVKVARIVGDGVALGVRPWRAPCVLLLMVWSCTDRWRWCGGRCGVSDRSLEVAQIVSRVRQDYQVENILYI